MTRTTLPRDARYLIDSITRKLSSLPPGDAEDLRPAIEAARAAVVQEEAELQAYIAAKYPCAADAAVMAGR